MLASVAAITRQSAHILSTSRRLPSPVNIQCLPSSLAATRSIVLFDPERLAAADAGERLLLLEHARGAVAARKSSCGLSVITFSGQVALHSPHCTQASSAKRSVGRSGSSPSAPVGQADTQARQSVQPATSISILPKGAPRAARRRRPARAPRGAARATPGAARRACRPRLRNSRVAAPARRCRWRAASRRARPGRRSRSWRRGRRQIPGPRGSAPRVRAFCQGRSRHGAALRAAAGAAPTRHRQTPRRPPSRPTCVTSLTASGSTFAGKPSPKRASASISGAPCASSWRSTTGRVAAGLAIGGEQGPQPAHQRIGRRQRIGGRAGRADGGALAAAGADMGVDRHVVAGGRDRAGRAEVEAAVAADDAGARMRADVLGEGDVARLVEGADEIARLEHRAQHRGRIARIGAQIAVAQIGGGKSGAPPDRSSTMSQRDTAPFFAAPNASAPREDGAGCA